LVLIEGTSYTGAWTWTSSGNAAAIVNPTTGAVNIVDPDKQLGLEMHQYMDSDGSGTHATINNNDPMTGVERLQDATQWLEQKSSAVFWEKFAVDNSIINKNNPSDPNNSATKYSITRCSTCKRIVVHGWGGLSGAEVHGGQIIPLFHIDPVNGVDQNVMPVLQQYLPKPAILTAMVMWMLLTSKPWRPHFRILHGWETSENRPGLKQHAGEFDCPTSIKTV